MAEVILYCGEPKGLTLGPSANPVECIHFTDGFARFDDADFPDWREWVAAPGTPEIEVLPSDTPIVPAGSAGSVDCPVCGKSFAMKVALTGHLKTHAPKG